MEDKFKKDLINVLGLPQGVSEAEIFAEIGKLRYLAQIGYDNQYNFQKLPRQLPAVEGTATLPINLNNERINYC